MDYICRFHFMANGVCAKCYPCARRGHRMQIVSVYFSILQVVLVNTFICCCNTFFCRRRIPVLGYRRKDVYMVLHYMYGIVSSCHMHKS